MTGHDHEYLQAPTPGQMEDGDYAWTCACGKAEPPQRWERLAELGPALRSSGLFARPVWGLERYDHPPTGYEIEVWDAGQPPTYPEMMASDLRVTVVNAVENILGQLRTAAQERQGVTNPPPEGDRVTTDGIGVEGSEFEPVNVRIAR
jgi:hypothetical protein